VSDIKRWTGVDSGRSCIFSETKIYLFNSYDHMKSRSVLSSSIQGFQSTHKRRLTTKNYHLSYTSSRTKTSEEWTLVLF